MPGNKNIARIGAITRDIRGTYGFRIGFNTPKEARQYKEMITWIIRNDKYTVIPVIGYHDIKNNQQMGCLQGRHTDDVL